MTTPSHFRHRQLMAGISALSLVVSTSPAGAQDFGRILGRIAERAVERQATETIDDMTRPQPRPETRSEPAPRRQSGRPASGGARQGPSETAHAGQTGVNAPATTEVSDIRVRAADARRMHDKLRALLAVVHAQPRMAGLNGFSLRNSVQARSNPDSPVLYGQGLTLVTLPVTGGSDCPSRDGLKASQCGPGLTLRANDVLASVLRDDGDFRGHVQLPMTPLPQHNGFDVFREGDQVVLTRAKPGVPLFVPMTRQEYLEYMATPGAAAELQTLSPAERAERACAATRRTILRRCEEGDLYMARPNPAYFDGRLGAGSVQLITISYFERDTDRHQVIRDALATLRAEDLSLD